MGRFERSGTALAAAAAVLVGGAGGYALASSHAGAITVCIRHRGGALYQARKCAKHDTTLSWNKQGPQGPAGAAGQQGLQGGQGPAGPFPSTLPVGATITGTFVVSGGAESPNTGNDWGYAVVSFPYPLANPPVPHYLTYGSAPTTACPGSVADPTATSGNLCLYEGFQLGTATPQICTPTINSSSACTPDQASRTGAVVRVFESATARWVHGGTWAVTG